MSITTPVLDDKGRTIYVKSDRIPGKSATLDSILAACGINVVKVLDEVEQEKSTLTDSLLAAPGINVQEVAGDVQMTDKVLKNNLLPKKSRDQKSGRSIDVGDYAYV